jgi:L-threonylcarbamoyladenylate synthase
MPGPLTLVLRKSAALPAAVTAGLPTVAVRMPDHPIARALLREAGVPVVAPSANLSGKPSPTTALHVQEDMEGKIAAILDGGRCRIGLESTVLDITGRQPVILRPGGISQEEIERALHVRVRAAASTHRKPRSPGMKYKHYAPKAELVLFEGERRSVVRAMRQSLHDLARSGKNVGVMAEDGASGVFGRALFSSLGKGGAAAAAHNLFAGFRSLDRRNADIILCQGFPEGSLGSALMNRLRKAASRRVRV